MKRYNYWKYSLIILILIFMTGCASISTIPSKPVVNFFTASPQTITVGESSTLSWEVSDATMVSIDQGVGNNLALSSSVSVSPTATTTYILTATNDTGTVTEMVQITVATNTYTVTFDSQGGSAVSSQIVEDGGLITEPTAPTKTDYTFDGWYKEPGCTNVWNFNTDTVTADITLYAKWNTNSYTVAYTMTYNGNGNTGGSVPVDPSSPYEYGATVTVLGNTGMLVKKGYTFVGWNTKADGSGTDQAEGSTFIMGTSGVTLFAKWTPLYALGDTGPAGGWIFYIKEGGYSDGWMYLEAAFSDQSVGTQWGCKGTSISGADGTAVGTGEQNTIDIEAGCITADTAADICATLISLGGYDDWFLPSKDELNLMYTNLKVAGVGGFTTWYWSSSEFSAEHAYVQYFLGGGQGTQSKDITAIRVRAVRCF